MLPSEKLLEKLKEQHDKHTVSVLVGAGFSKNAIKEYPDWDGLLRDLVVDVYGNKIAERYRQYRAGTGPLYYTEEAFIDREIANTIHEVGYLNLVSKYIEDKGYREAIDVYIEDHLPYVEETNGVFKVSNMPNLTFTARNLDIHKELLLCKWKHVYTTNYDNLLELANNIYGMDYRKITADYELARLSEQRGIVKVHGNLVGDSLSNDYGFDNDKSRRYIISADDYATYAEKHQAFSYQMKTGLLTGVFCLIGFSGNDPNFLGWLEWMKDVLDRDVTDPNKENTKIFLLTIGSQQIEKSRQLFYQNHHIGIINILDDGVLKLIGITQPLPDVKAVFSQLFRYLNDGTAYVINPTCNIITNTQSQYQRVWTAIDAQNVTNTDVSEVRRLRKNIVMPPIAKAQRMVINDLHDKKEWTKQDAELFALACVDCGLWFFKFREAEKEHLLKNVLEWQRLKQMGAVLQNEDLDFSSIEDADWRTELEVMQAGYRLETQRRNEIVSAWTTGNDKIVKKAAVVALTDAKTSSEMVEAYLKTSTDAERRYYASLLGNILSFQHPPKYSYNEFKTAGISGYDECRDAMLKVIEYEKKEVKPYGSDGWSFMLAKSNPDVEEALRFAELLFISGLPLQMRGYSLINPQDWYEVFKRIYDYMPYPALYYSLQLSDKKTLSRIGQDYVFAEPFVDIVPDMLTKLLSAVVEDAKGINQESCLCVAKEMLCSVADDVWYELVLAVFNKVLVPNVATISSLSSLYQFMKDASFYLKDPKKKSAFLSLLLEHFDENIYCISELIYKLHLKEGVVLTEKQKDEVREVMEKYPLDKSFLVSAHLGYCGLLSEDIKQLLRDRIKGHPEEVERASFEELHSLTFITFGDEEATKIVKHSILGKNIWSCGVNENSASSPNYLALNKTSRDIKWTETELHQIMDNLQKNLTLLEGWKGLGDGFMEREHVGLLTDMMEFTEHICIAEAKQTEYDKVAKRIRELMLKAYGSSQILDNIFDKEAIVNQELQFLARCIDFYGLEKYRVYVDTVIDRALLQCEQSLTMVLAFVEFLVEKHLDDLKDEKTVYRLKMLLKRYVDVDYQKLNLSLSVAYRCLGKVADVLKSNGLAEGMTVDYWLNNEFVKRFSE